MTGRWGTGKQGNTEIGREGRQGRTMTRTQSRGRASNQTMVSAGETFLEAVGFKRELPRLLLVKVNGQIFQERQVGFLGNGGQPNPLQQLDYLMREDAVGGAEPIVHENKTVLLEKFATSIGQRLAETDEENPAPQFLGQVIESAEKFKRECDAQLAQLEERYTQAQTRLKKWQEDYGREKSLLTKMLALGGALFGGNVSLSEAGQLWNRRELLHKNREAWRAASEMWAAVIQVAGSYARNLDAMKLSAQLAIQQSQLERAQLETELANARPWTYAVDYQTLADEFRASDADPVLLAELLTTAREDGSDAVAAKAKEIARREMERWVSNRDLPQFIEMEARAALNGNGDEMQDPLVLVGENLLDQVRWQFPTWQLTRQARPRKLTLQITPSGEPLFENANLTTARYGERNDRLGFLDAELDVALDEMRLVVEGKEQFEEARRGREYFILEELASAFPSDDFPLVAPFPNPPSMPSQSPLVLNETAATASSTVASTMASDDGSSQT